jgi:hypothetical protein
MLRQDCTLPLCFALFFLFRGGFSEARISGKHLRELLSKERWTAFLWPGLTLLPLGLKAWVTGDSDENHLALLSFYVILACSGALTADGPRPTREIDGRAGAALCAAFVPAPAHAAPSNVAWRYTRAHPGVPVFQRNPPAVYLAAGKRYNFDPALHDREVADFPVVGSRLNSGLPPRVDLVAMPPGEQVYFEQLARDLKSWPIASDPELPDWTVYVRPGRARTE